MPQVYFNVGRANRQAGSEHLFATVNPITPDPAELVLVELNLPANQLTDPNRNCRMELYRSLDGVTWQFLAAINFVGDAENTINPYVGLDGYVFSGYYVRARIILGSPMNVGFMVHSRAQNG